MCCSCLSPRGRQPASQWQGHPSAPGAYSSVFMVVKHSINASLLKGNVTLGEPGAQESGAPRGILALPLFLLNAIPESLSLSSTSGLVVKVASVVKYPPGASWASLNHNCSCCGRGCFKKWSLYSPCAQRGKTFRTSKDPCHHAKSRNQSGEWLPPLGFSTRKVLFGKPQCWGCSPKPRCPSGLYPCGVAFILGRSFEPL